MLLMKDRSENLKNYNKLDGSTLMWPWSVCTDMSLLENALRQNVPTTKYSTAKSQAAKYLVIALGHY